MEAIHPTVSELLQIVIDAEKTVKPRKSQPIPVPEKWYNELLNEQARDLMNTIHAPLKQFNRIKDVENSGVDFEIMKNGFKVFLTELNQFYKKAIEDLKRLPKIARERKNFKQKYTPIKGLKGNLKAAILEAEAIKLKYPNKYDPKYTLFHKISMENFLCEKEMNVLMDKMTTLNFF